MINITTKKAEDTQGGLVTAGAGNQERGFGAVRYGGKLSDRGYYRFFAKYFNRDDLATSSGQDAADAWNMLRGGFRTDWKLPGRDSLTVQGDFYDGKSGQTVPRVASLSAPTIGLFDDRAPLVGGNLLGRWNHTFSDKSDTALQLYYDRSDREEMALSVVQHTFDLDFQHHFVAGSRHDIVWGAAYRFSADQTAGSLTISFNPSSHSLSLFSAFLQDEITLLPDRLRLTLGTKLEYDSHSDLDPGLEVQPNVRLLWTPNRNHSIWAAVSRAIRRASRVDSSLRINLAAFPGQGGTLNLLSLFGTQELRDEKVLANEFGYRAQLGRRVSIDLAAFYNLYEDLRTIEPAAPFFEDKPPPPHLVLPLVFQNGGSGKTYGIELAPTWNVTSRWKLSGGYSWLQADLQQLAANQNPAPRVNSPQHQWNLRSSLNLPRNVEFDTSVYYVGRLSELGIPSYTRLDTRLGWRPAESLEISVVGQNLLDSHHVEFASVNQRVNATQVKRSFYGKVTWRF